MQGNIFASHTCLGEHMFVDWGTYVYMSGEMCFITWNKAQTSIYTHFTA